MSLILLSFFAGILTVLAPCSFMLLPIIIGGSVGKGNQYRPYIITASLAISLFLFTVLLKATSLLINIDPIILNYISGVIVIFLGLISLFPELWDRLTSKLNLSGNSDKLLLQAQKKEGVIGSILTGAALGPVFSACSPTYVYILTTVLRQDLTIGLINIFAYITGLALIMLGAGLLGRRFTNRMKWAVNPNGIFKKIIAVLFIIVGIAIISGFDKLIQSTLSPINPFNQLEKNILQNAKPSSIKTDNSKLFNVSPAISAPELRNISAWINSNGESIQKLKGKVVLIDFWTYSCVNCLRSAPYINNWYDKYRDQGLEVIGLHAPEFAFEKIKENVEKSVRETYKIKYPVGLDNDFSTWDDYKNQFWPAKYLIDKEGMIRYTHFGEGEYDKTELAIRELIKETGKSVDSITTDNNIVTENNKDLTPETYLGWSRAVNFANTNELNNYGVNYNYNLVPELQKNNWSISGTWKIDKEDITSQDDNAKLVLNYNAKEVYIVAGSDLNSNVKITSNSKSLEDQKGDDVEKSSSIITINNSKLYKLIKHETITNSQIELIVPKGVKLNVFTFG